MILMSLRADNFYCFHHFEISFSYPKKPVHSFMEETLAGFPGFRYNKVNVIMGANASGKTSLGRVIAAAFAFLHTQDVTLLRASAGDIEKKAFLQMDFIPEGKTLYRLSIDMAPVMKEGHSMPVFHASLQKEKILRTDTYEKCLKRLVKQEKKRTTDFPALLADCPSFYNFFAFSDEISPAVSSDTVLYQKILKKVLGTLDLSLIRITRVPESESNDFLIQFRDQKEPVLLHHRKIQPSDLSRVSTGIRAGVRLASILTAVKEGECSFFYGDDLFDGIQSDVQRAVLAVLMTSLKENMQLFVTSRNPGLLDMALPLHDVIFLRKDPSLKECPVRAVQAGKQIKKNNVSLKNAAENDLFSWLPELSGIYDIENL